jgi:hypothetical protein
MTSGRGCARSIDLVRGVGRGRARRRPGRCAPSGDDGHGVGRARGRSLTFSSTASGKDRDEPAGACGRRGSIARGRSPRSGTRSFEAAGGVPEVVREVFRGRALRAEARGRGPRWRRPGESRAPRARRRSRARSGARCSREGEHGYRVCRERSRGRGACARRPQRRPQGRWSRHAKSARSPGSSESVLARFTTAFVSSADGAHGGTNGATACVTG